MREAIGVGNNQPFIVAFKNVDDDEDALPQYFIGVEQHLMLESSTILSAIYFCVAAHYVFNLNYHKKSGSMWTFIQEKNF